MQSSDIPTWSPLRFGQDAAGANIRPIPQTTADTAAASFDLGFPPATFVPPGAGGVFPDGRDFNGIFNFLSAWAQWQGMGGAVPYNPSVSAGGGYPLGATVASATTLGVYWFCTAENNTTNPDSGGTGWRRWSLAGGLLNTQVFSSSGIYTPTPGTSFIVVTVTGGGGGGGGSPTMGGAQFAAAGGGGSGGSAKSRILTGFSGLPVTIGAGGAGGVGAISGTTGGTTSFGSLLTADGGTGGSFANAASIGSTQLGGAGGSASGGNIFNASGSPGQSAVSFASSNMVSGAGGSSIFGGGGAAVGSSTSNGRNGSAPGAGGSGAMTQSSGAQQAGGVGANGYVIIEEYA
jgi:hypothetical protein